MDKNSFSSMAAEHAARMAAKHFRFHPDAETLVSDAMSVAWELAQQVPDNATEKTVAQFAVKRVVMGRQFRQSTRSCEGPNPLRWERPQRAELDLGEVSRPGDDPAEIACFWLTFLPWLESLSALKRQVALALILGDQANAVAKQHRLSVGRVSQIRRELKEHWEVVTA